MNNFIHSWIGGLHVGFAVMAMILGTIVLLRKKGDILHVRIGYAYVFCMLGLNITAFGLYHLFGTFGIFHVLALLSLFSIVGGMYPVLNRSKVENWKIKHLEVMCWSVVGLFAAFWAETGVRLFNPAKFWWVVALASGLTCAIGSYLIRKRVAAETNEAL